MHWRLVILLLVLAMPSVAAAEGPGVVMLVHHPNDGIDPLGFGYKDGRDAFLVRHGHFDVFRNGVEFPGFVADGRVPFEGLPQGGDPLAETIGIYDAVVTMRQGQQTPVTIGVTSQGADMAWNVTARFETGTDLSGERLRMWSAVVEDPVHYRPPTGLTNGVFEHPFTVRAITDHGPIELADRIETTWNVTLDPAWDPLRSHVAVWIQQGAEEGRFDAREVVQATLHPLAATEATVQSQRGVLIEGYSATWCEPCLIGDLALEQVAFNHGLQPARAEPEPGPAYFQAPGQAGIVAVLAAAGFALFALVRLRGGEP